MMNSTKANKGFTLIELVFIIVILGILSVAAIPKLEQAKLAEQKKVQTEKLKQSGTTFGSGGSTSFSN